MTVSLICWALWSYDCQSDVGLCGRMTVSLICWALWSYDCQSDMLGFVAVRLLDSCNFDFRVHI